MDKINFLGTGYLDGIPVKIGERFQPPIKVTLPLNYKQRNPTDVLNDDYDFGLERRILELAQQKRKMKEMKERVKDEQVASRIEQFTRLGNSDSSDGSPTGSGNNVPSSSGDSSECAPTENHKPVMESDSTPTPNPNPFAHYAPKNMLQPETANRTTASPQPPPQPPPNAIKLEDFESESSPFDSVELKTLNDMEELKNVLQSMDARVTNERYANHQQYGRSNRNDNLNFSTCQPYQQHEQQYPITTGSNFDRLPTYSTYTMQWNNVPDNVYHHHQTYCYPHGDANVPSLRAARSTPDLTSEQDESSEPANAITTPHLPRPSSVGSVQSFGPDRYDELDEGAKMLTRQMTDMGFPRPRSVRAILKLGVDDKKVVEHLCCVQSMVESGFDAERAEMALFMHDQDQKQAQNYLRLVKQFVDLGFEETAIKQALSLHDNDRDKALDYLVS